MIRRNRRSNVLVLALAIVAAAAVPAVATGVSGTAALTLHAGLSTAWQSATCPAGTTGANPYCYAIRGAGVVRGLGQTSESYVYVIDDQSAAASNIHFTATITVPQKGTIDISAKTPSPVCPCTAHSQSLDYTVTGGTAAYAGAQGSGKVVVGTKLATWSGTVTVPGYRFDTSAPVISGATAKTVKAPAGAKRARVAYKVTAKDADEGSLPVRCTPRSGSLFKVGRTTVHCTAMDANGNSAKASFRVTVKGG